MLEIPQSGQIVREVGMSKPAFGSIRPCHGGTFPDEGPAP